MKNYATTTTKNAKVFSSELLTTFAGPVSGTMRSDESLKLEDANCFPPTNLYNGATVVQAPTMGW